jgi:outer membrane receptor for ferrienterochelin and colicins
MIHTAGRAAGGAAVLMALISPAWAQSAAPDEIDSDLSLAALLDVPKEVWAASRTEQRNEDAPAIITTLTGEQIAVWGYRSVAEVLSHLLGFYVVDDHTSPNLAVRGISGGLYSDSSIVKVLLDGHPVAFHSTGGNWLGPELVPLSAIERIEIVRGPASALFGADAFLGVINIKTRNGASLNGASTSVTVGRVGKHTATDVDASAGLQRGAFDVFWAVRHNQQDLSGLTLPPSSPAPSLLENRSGPRQARGLQQTSTTTLLRVSRRGPRGGEVGVFGYYSSMLRGAEFGSLIQLANGYSDGIPSENRVSQSQLRAGLFWDQPLGPRSRLSLRGAVFQGGPKDDNRLEVGSEIYYVRRRFGFRGADLDGQLEWNPAGSVRLVGGATGFVDDELLPSRLGVVKQATADAQPGDVIDSLSLYQGRRTFFNAGAYLQSSWNPLDRLGVTGGLRYDRHNVYGGQLSERIGLVAHPLPGLDLKLLYGSAFKAPSPVLLHAAPSAVGDVAGNPELSPQRLRSVDLELRWTPAPFLGLSSVVAYGVLSNKAEFVQHGISQVARNVSRAETLSWESMAELKLGEQLRAHVSFETQRTVRQTGLEGYSGWVVGSGGGVYPSAMVHAGILAQPRGFPVRLAVQSSYVGVRRPSDTNILLNDGLYLLPSYLLLEACLSTVGFDLFGGRRSEVSVSLNGKNLLGVTGPAPGFSGVDYPLAPRAVLLQVNVRL